VVSDTKSLRVGVREVSYELSLFDTAGALGRVEVDPTDPASGELPLIDVRHQAIKQSPLDWAQSLTPSGERSAAVRVAQQTFARYRNYPSIVPWFGQNEGVPYPALNEGLDALVYQLLQYGEPAGLGPWN
jgi:hypothetical protein